MVANHQKRGQTFGRQVKDSLSLSTPYPLWVAFSLFVYVWGVFLSSYFSKLCQEKSCHRRWVKNSQSMSAPKVKIFSSLKIKELHIFINSKRKKFWQSFRRIILWTCWENLCTIKIVAKHIGKKQSLVFLDKNDSRKKVENSERF